jgi:HPt (histidine-containing phosphotransfer) domain-containing protein
MPAISDGLKNVIHAPICETESYRRWGPVTGRRHSGKSVIVSEPLVKSWFVLQRRLIAGLQLAYVDLHGAGVSNGSLIVAFPEHAGHREEPALADLGHWLKGAGGTVGFNQFTVPARDLEAAAKAADDQQIGVVLRKLRDVAEPIPGVDFSSRFTDPPIDDDQADAPDPAAKIDVPEDEPIVSRLAGHPRMQPLIERFVTQLVEAADTMQKAWQSGDSEALLDRTRWLKGSAGTLGFDVFTEPA